jgi:hypothetical protein
MSWAYWVGVVSRRYVSWRAPLFVFSVLPMAISGCGGTSETVSVQGNISYRGTPLSKAVVTFYPSVGRPISAPTSESGDYTVELPPGDYTTVVNVGSEIPPGYKEGDPLPPAKISLPADYTMQSKSTLSASIKDDQTEPINFALE